MFLQRLSVQGVSSQGNESTSEESILHGNESDTGVAEELQLPKAQVASPGRKRRLDWCVGCDSGESYPGLICSNITLNPDTAYVLYVGDPKYIHTTSFLKQTLAEGYRRPVEVINILPNLPSPYFEGSFAVVNAQLAEHMREANGSIYHLPLDQPEINIDVCNCEFVHSLIEEILEEQADLYVNLFKSTPEMTLGADPRINVIGPRGSLYCEFDNKLNQRQIVDGLGIPTPRSFVAENLDELVQMFEAEFYGEAFVTSANGFGGNGTQRVENATEILSCEKFRNRSGYIISEYLTLKSSPCSLAVVANENEVIVASIADQVMDGPTYVGTVYPSEAGEEHLERMKDYTERIGRYLGGKGYRGFFGVDFMIDDRGKLFFVEINPRKIGSTLESMYAHYACAPEAISLAELELSAVREGIFPISASDYRFPDLHWGIMGVKANGGERTVRSIVPQRMERDLFLHSGAAVFDHPGENVTFLSGGRLARIVAVMNKGSANNRAEILRLLEQQSKNIN